ncbi:MAG: tripartite tricarboxylate transporter substrate binding protein [Comamonadaceae bacterium]|nr:MAG: tripartite tricarboxylate transporter substrate binding protein [Comamonadaceae bacterium]
MSPRFIRLAAALAASTFAWLALPASAQVAYPERPLRIVIGQAAGGAVDTVARTLAEGLGQALGQPVTVENKPGAGGMVAAESVARAPRDGYTLGLLDVGSLAVNPVLQAKIRYDVNKDFSFVGSVARIPLALVAHPSVPVDTLADLTRQLKANPGKFSYASAGVGSPPHLTFEAYKQRAGVFVTHLPYRGGAPALADVVAGHVPLTVIDTNLANQYLKDKRIKVLAVATTQRSPLMPQVPTFVEAGLADFEFAPWVGLVAPAGLNAATAARLSAALAQVMGGADFQARMRNIGFVSLPGDGAALEGLVKADLKRYGTLIREQGIRLED